MCGESPQFLDLTRICMRPAHCPVCGEPNHCRMETGEPYKGPCWCERPALSGAALRRLLADLPELRCLCPGCLETIASNPDVTWNELTDRSQWRRLASMENDYYLEDGCVVFTAQYHLRRGHCCGSGCRHYPFAAVRANDVVEAALSRSDVPPCARTGAPANPGGTSCGQSRLYTAATS